MKDKVMSRVDDIIRLLGHSEALKVSDMMVDWMWDMDEFTDEEEELFKMWTQIGAELIILTEDLA